MKNLKQMLLALVGLCLVQCVSAQITVGDTPERYYTSLPAMLADEYVETPYLTDMVRDNQGLIRFRMKDKALRKALRKEARIVVHQDSLLLNLRKLSYQGFDLGAGYTQAWMLNDTTLMFFAPDAGWKAFGKELGVAMGTGLLTMGMTGGFGYVVVFMNGWACYTYTGDGHKVQRLNRERTLEWLKEYDGLLYYDYTSLTEHDQKQQRTIQQFMYRLVHPSK